MLQLIFILKKHLYYNISMQKNKKVIGSIYSVKEQICRCLLDLAALNEKQILVLTKNLLC